MNSSYISVSCTDCLLYTLYLVQYYMASLKHSEILLKFSFYLKITVHIPVHICVLFSFHMGSILFITTISCTWLIALLQIVKKFNIFLLFSFSVSFFFCPTLSLLVCVCVCVCETMLYMYVYMYIYFTWSPFVSLLSRRAQYGRWSSFGKRVWFTESHIVLIISFLLVALFTQFILDII